MASHLFLANRSMDNEYFSNADGEFLVVPQQGRLLFYTEFGKIEIVPGDICAIPRGVIFSVLCRWDTTLLVSTIMGTRCCVVIWCDNGTAPGARQANELSARDENEGSIQ